MTKFLTVMTVFVLFGLNSQAQSFKEVQVHMQKVQLFTQAVKEMNSISESKLEQFNIKQVQELTAQAKATLGDSLAYCKEKQAEIKNANESEFLQKESLNSKATEEAIAALSTSDSELKAARSEYIRLLGSVRFCLRTTSLYTTVIRAKISGSAQ